MIEFEKPQRMELFYKDGSRRTIIISALAGGDGILEVQTRDEKYTKMMVIIHWGEIRELASREATYEETQETWYTEPEEY